MKDYFENEPIPGDVIHINSAYIHPVFIVDKVFSDRLEGRTIESFVDDNLISPKDGTRITKSIKHNFVPSTFRNDFVWVITIATEDQVRARWDIHD